MTSRPQEIEEYSNRYFVHPVSRRLATVLARLDVHPNLVSFAGIFFGLSAALAYYHFDQAGAAVLGFAFMVAWHVLDGTDGQLARLSGKATTAGKVIDGFADYSVFLTVYISLGVAGAQGFSWPVAGLVVLAAASHILQAAALERERETYVFWVYSGQAGKQPGRGPMPSNPLLYWLYFGYLRVQNFLDSVERVKQHGFDLALGPHRRALAAEKYRELYSRHIRRWWVLSANTHTVAIFIFAALGYPVWYFVFEATVLNTVLLLLLWDKRRRDRAFMAWLEGLERNSPARDRRSA